MAVVVAGEMVLVVLVVLVMILVAGWWLVKLLGVVVD